MEQTDSGECHGNSILVADVDDVVIADGTARLSDIADTALMLSLIHI